MILLFLGDLLLVSLSYELSFLIRYGTITFYTYQYSWTLTIFVLIYAFAFYLADLYNIKTDFRNAAFVSRFLATVTIAAALEAGVFFFVPSLKSGRGTFIINAPLVAILTYSWRLLFEYWFRSVLKRQKRLLIVGAGWAGMSLYEIIRNNRDYDVAGFIDDNPGKIWLENYPKVIGGCNKLTGIVTEKKIDIVIIAVTHVRGAELIKNALECKMRGVLVYDMPAFFEEVTGKVPVEHVDDFWLVSTPLLGINKSVYNQKIKRLLDVIISMSGLFFTFPILITAAATIKIGSSGPVFYKQRRIGLNGKSFTLIKFRTMKVGTEGDREFAGRRDDPRITAVGRMIRFFRIDEIPQMWNVIKGEMSFIGPRALIEEEVAEFEQKVQYFSLRHAVRPGITGWAQINYHHGTTVEDALQKLEYDLFYIKNLTPFLDLFILLRTVKVVLFGKGAK